MQTKGWEVNNRVRLQLNDHINMAHRLVRVGPHVSSILLECIVLVFEEHVLRLICGYAHKLEEILKNRLFMIS